MVEGQDTAIELRVPARAEHSEHSVLYFTVEAVGDVSLKDGAVSPWSHSSSPYYAQTLESLARHFKQSMQTPWRDLPEKMRDTILQGSGGEPVEILRVSHEVEREQVAELARRRAGRDQAAVDAALAAMIAAAESGENMIPPMLRAARAEATLGEICGALRDKWGTYSETPAF